MTEVALPDHHQLFAFPELGVVVFRPVGILDAKSFPSIAMEVSELVATTQARSVVVDESLLVNISLPTRIWIITRYLRSPEVKAALNTMRHVRVLKPKVSPFAGALTRTIHNSIKRMTGLSFEYLNQPSFDELGDYQGQMANYVNYEIAPKMVSAG